MKKILQFTGSFHQGGSERQAVQLIKLLREDESHQVFVATLNNEGVLKKEIENLGFGEIPEFKLTSFYDLNFIRQIRKCAQFLRENDIRIVQTHDFYTNVFGITAAKLAGVSLKIAAKRETGGMRTASQKFIESRMFQIADYIVANSQAVKNYLLTEKVAGEKIKVIYNGLDLERLTPKIRDRQTICEKLNLPCEAENRFITLVANLRHSVKNQPMFLRAAQKVTGEFPNVHFVLAGEGGLKEELENLAKELKIEKNVHLIGRCTEVPELLSISEAGVLTSFNEGFSNSILEYMAAGKPVVATNVGGASEAIIENETGFLVESDDAEKMAVRLKELLTDQIKARKFGEKGAEIVKSKFSLATQLRETLALYDKV